MVWVIVGIVTCAVGFHGSEGGNMCCGSEVVAQM